MVSPSIAPGIFIEQTMVHAGQPITFRGVTRGSCSQTLEVLGGGWNIGYGIGATPAGEIFPAESFGFEGTPTLLTYTFGPEYEGQTIHLDLAAQYQNSGIEQSFSAVLPIHVLPPNVTP